MIDETVVPIALVLHLKTGFSLESNIVSENTKGTFTADQTWFEELYIPNDSVHTTIGTDGEVRKFGLYQINIRVPLNQGRLGALAYAQEIGLKFKPATKLYRSGYEIFIEKCEPAQGFQDDNWYLVPVTVYWSCDMTIN